MIIDLSEISTQGRQRWLQAAIGPRPIALVSTIDRDGNPNLAPFSFFNLFSTDPPIVIFSPCRRVKDGSRKHTLMNIEEVPEAGIHVVTEEILDKVNQCSFDYPEGVNEFREAGLTPVAATVIRTPLVKESLVKFECKVIQVMPLGDRGGAGNLIVAELLMMHVDEHLLHQNGAIDPALLHHVARLGDDWYARVRAENLFQLPKPIQIS